MTPYSDYVLADDKRTGRWSLAMAWWALFSAMFWLYIAVASAESVGMTDTIIGMALTIASYGAINAVLARFGARTGLTVELLSRSLFGVLGSAVATLIFAATAIYYAVFEGSVIAVAFQSYFGGPIKVWYLAVVVYALPLVAGGVQNWLDRLNGWLLPFYCVGLIAAVIATAVRAGAPRAWPHGTAGGLPGWLSSYLIYMGVYIMMMYTFDYARHGRQRDDKFHANVTFGWVFYLFTFGVNGLIGVYLVYAWGEGGTETGVAQAMVKALGFAGLLVIFVSQTRINSANYYLASTNLDAFAARVFRLKLPRWAWVIASGVIAYVFMLTDVLSYLLKALAWQGVFVTAWVAIALVYIALSRRTAGTLPEVTEDRLPTLTAGAFIWVLASAIGIYLTEQTSSADLAALAPLITVAIAAGGYFVAYRVQPPVTRPAREGVAVGELALPPSSLPRAGPREEGVAVGELPFLPENYVQAEADGRGARWIVRVLAWRGQHIRCDDGEEVTHHRDPVRPDLQHLGVRRRDRREDRHVKAGFLGAAVREADGVERLSGLEDRMA